MLHKIVSSGQAGAERAALDWAIQNSIAHGGFCPKGRRAEDGSLDTCYQLTELTTVSHASAIEANVRHSDGTLIITADCKFDNESANAAKFCGTYKRPFLHTWLNQESLSKIHGFILAHKISVLHIAGTKASRCSTISVPVFAALRAIDRVRRVDPVCPPAVTKSDAQELFFLAAELERLGQRFRTKVEDISLHLGDRGKTLPRQSEDIWRRFSEEQFDLIARVTV